MYDKIKIHQKIGQGLAIQIAILIMSYLTTPLLVKYLGMNNFGLWTSIFSILNWIYMCDLGVGNELKNRLIKSRIKNEQEYITNIFKGYIFYLKVGIFFLLISLSVIIILKQQNNFFKENLLLILIILILTIINFIVSFYKILYISKHDVLTEKKNQLSYQILFYILVIILLKIKYYSLELIAAMNIFLMILFGIIYTIKFFNEIKFYKKLKVYFKIKPLKKIVMNKKSLYFFIIQLSMIIILSTDNIIIAKYSNFNEVSRYNIISKLYQPFLLIGNYILSQYWSLFSEAFLNKDIIWIKKNILKLRLIVLLLIPILIIFSLFLPIILKVWIETPIKVSIEIRILFSIYIFILNYSGIYMCFLNSISDIKLQTILYLFGAIINIPLSIYLLKIMGIKGVILATNLCLISLAIMLPYYVKKKLKDRS